MLTIFKNESSISIQSMRIYKSRKSDLNLQIRYEKLSWKALKMIIDLS